MSKIKSKRTRPEMVFHNILKGNKVRHKMWPDMYGHPDVLIYPYTLVFVNGCFWHGCKRHFRMPQSNTSFWKNKIRNNAKRQRKVINDYRKNGYRVIVVWEHDLR